MYSQRSIWQTVSGIYWYSMRLSLCISWLRHDCHFYLMPYNVTTQSIEHICIICTNALLIFFSLSYAVQRLDLVRGTLSRWRKQTWFRKYFFISYTSAITIIIFYVSVIFVTITNTVTTRRHVFTICFIFLARMRRAVTIRSIRITMVMVCLWAFCIRKHIIVTTE